MRATKSYITNAGRKPPPRPRLAAGGGEFPEPTPSAAAAAAVAFPPRDHRRVISAQAIRERAVGNRSSYGLPSAGETSFVWVLVEVVRFFITTPPPPPPHVGDRATTVFAPRSTETQQIASDFPIPAMRRTKKKEKKLKYTRDFTPGVSRSTYRHSTFPPDTPRSCVKRVTYLFSFFPNTVLNDSRSLPPATRPAGPLIN